MHKCPRTPRTAIATAAALAPSTWVASLAPTARVPTAARASGFLRPSAQRLATGLPTDDCYDGGPGSEFRARPGTNSKVCVCVHNLLIVNQSTWACPWPGGGHSKVDFLGRTLFFVP